MNYILLNLKNQHDVEGLMRLHVEMNQKLRAMMKDYKSDIYSTRNREMIRSWIRSIEQAMILFVPQSFEQSTFKNYGRR